MNIAEKIMATSLLFGAALITNFTYLIQHRRKYGEGKEPAHVSAAFSPLMDKYLRLSTFSLGVLSCWINSAILLQPLKNRFWLITGAIIVILAETLFIWAMMSLGRQYSPCYDSFIPKAIITNGPYSSIRHPIYTANIFLIMGIALLSGTLILIPNILILGAGYYRAAVQEESYLCSYLPEYREYLQRTGMFLPYWGRDRTARTTSSDSNRHST